MIVPSSAGVEHLLISEIPSFRRKTEQEYEDEIHEFGGGVREGHRPVPLFLVVMLALLIAWAVGYTIYSGSNYPY